MRKLIEQFPAHILESLQLATSQPLSGLDGDFCNVVISGLGGSGIGGSMVADLSRNSAEIPVIINKEYSIPAFVDNHTLFIACSYSGNTEETLEAIELAHARGAHIVCITSGGKLETFAKEHGHGLRIIPGGHPPRAAFGYSLTQLVDIFAQAGLLPANYTVELRNAANRIAARSSEIDGLAREWAEKLNGTIPVIYAEASVEAVAVRFRQQINENGKMLCWHHVVPEMNHNELVGWTQKNDNLSVIFIRNSSDYARNQTRMEINKSIVGKYTDKVFEMWSEGETEIERLLYLVHLGDFISLHIADLRNVDVVEVRVIDFLKGELAKQS